MSDERHKLLLQLNDNSVRDRSELRHRINRLKRNIAKRLKELDTEHANKLAESINNTDDTKRMFEATRALATGNKQTEPISVFNSDNQLVGNEEEKACIVRQWFLQHYKATSDSDNLRGGQVRSRETEEW